MKTPIKIYDWKCPKCGKLIISIYEKQFEANKKSHEINCKGLK